MLFILLIITFSTLYGAMNELRKFHPDTYEWLGGVKSTYSESSKMDVAGFFLAFGYLRFWSKINKKFLFILASMSMWATFVYVIWYLIQLL